MADSELRDRMERLLVSRGLTFLACADLTPLQPSVRHDLPIGVCLGIGLDPGIVSGISDGPTREYAAHYREVNRLLNELSQLCARFLREQGYRAEPFQASQSMPEGSNLSTPLPHKTVATRAGVGWIGRCALLVTESYGSAVRFNTVLTDAPVPTGSPVETSQCDDCTSCVEACPAEAPLGGAWEVGIPRDDFFDAYSCRRMARALAEGVGIEHPICGICIAACPHTQSYLERSAGRPGDVVDGSGAPGETRG
jgi:epoxyqueuosine reductase QueG